MIERGVRVFFYGLFMDAQVLARQGVHAAHPRVGLVEGLRLRIGARATLVPAPTARAHGVVMRVPREELTALYAEPSVADYVAEDVEVTLADGGVETARCYVLPEGQLAGTNRDYAEQLLTVARELGLPDEALDAIRKERDGK